MIFHFRADVPDPGPDGSCDEADKRVAALMMQATTDLVLGNHPGRIVNPDASAEFGYGPCGEAGRAAESSGPAAPGWNLPVMLCSHGCVLCAPCGFIPESWRPT